ncbi:MAG: YggT family protein [Gemmatimonadota bacterium]|nr:YggT family protein [Gemmatimonadota bacterium]
MSALLYGLDYLANALRGGFLAFAAAVALFCVLDWMVRTRRINPFGAFAGFLRSNIRPFIAPVERRLLRSGGNPAAAPWWTLVVVVLAGIVLLSVLDFVREQLAITAVMLDGGPTGYYRLVVSWVFGILRLALIGRVLLSWVRPSPFAWYVRASYALTEWYLRPLRGIIPLFGMIDVTPLIAYILLGVVQGFLVRLA